MLTIDEVKTVEDINQINWSKYTDNCYYGGNGWIWIRMIRYANATDLDRIVHLSQHPKSKFKMYWAMGNLYVREVK